MSEWHNDPFLQTVENQFFQFLISYGETSENEAHYVTKINQAVDMYESGALVLEVNIDHMLYSPTIANITVQIFERLPLYMPNLYNAARHFLQQQLPQLSTSDVFVDLYFTNVNYATDLHSLKAEDIGKYTQLTGTVIRVYNVYPELIRGCFRCQVCSTVINDVVYHYGYTEPICPTCRSITAYDLMYEMSIYENYQKIRIQDDSSGSNQLLDVVLRNNLTGILKPGDPVILHGYLVALPSQYNKKRVNSIIKEVQQGYSVTNYRTNQVINHQVRKVANTPNQPTFIYGDKKLPRELSFYLSFIAIQVYNKISRPLHDYEEMIINKMVNQSNNIIYSFAPHIFGLTYVKTAILLYLIGGVEKQTTEKLSIRPDINVLLVGDPACAKSTLLKYAAKFSDRGVYTSGKSASIAGLTAAIVQDDENEWGVEAGAILRANNGICCIDEFEKISLADYSALHEIMEQYSVSLSKAGVQATLKAKTPVLAAMNPINGRYDQMRSLRQNINITPAILSRFDLVFVVQDQPDQQIDLLIARRIIDTACGVKQGQNFTEDEIKVYLQACKQLKPNIQLDAQRALQDIWVNLRQNDLNVVGMKNYRITVRQLESLVRLSETYAKFELSEVVTVEHVQKAKELLETTMVKVEAEKEVFYLQDEEDRESQEPDDLEEDIEYQDKHNLVIEISSAELTKLALIVRFAMLSAGESSFTRASFMELARLNIDLSEHELTERYKQYIYADILDRMIEDKIWVNRVIRGDEESDEEDNDDTKYIFTHLAPEI